MPSLKKMVTDLKITPNPSGVKKIVTEEFLSSYAFVHEPRATDENQEPKYSIQLIFEKTNTKAIKALIQVAANAASSKWGTDVSKWPKMKYNIMTSDLELDEGELSGVEKHLHGKIMLNARNKNKPGIVGPDAKPLMDPEDFYSGCMARASLGVFAYDNVSKGVSFSLNNLMKTKDGNRLDGQTKAEDDFNAFATEDTGGSEASGADGF